jgi:hypothetical protein
MTTEEHVEQVQTILENKNRIEVLSTARITDATTGARKYLKRLREEKKKLRDQIDKIDALIAATIADNGAALVKTITINKLREINRLKEDLFVTVETAPDKAALMTALGDEDAAKVQALLN